MRADGWVAQSRRLAGVKVLQGLALLLALLGASHAAVDTADRMWYSYEDLKAMSDNRRNHDFYFQIPDSPRGVVAMFHGCVGSGSDYWPQSPACPDCRGLPEQMSHVLQSLNRGYAFIALSSGDRDTGCWSWNIDSDDVASIIPSWMREWGLDGLPLYGMGISSGGSFMLKMPRMLKMDGVVSEALAIDPPTWGLDETPVYPPTIFVNMVRDANQQDKYREDLDTLRNLGRPIEIIKVYERPVYPTYFSERSPYYISPDFSQQLAFALHDMGMIDDDGYVLEDPRDTLRPWLVQLQQLVPELGGDTQKYEDKTVPKFFSSSSDVNGAGVYSLMNLAYAKHEIISDYVTAALMWFESGASADLDTLVNDYTYGWPPDNMAGYKYGAQPPPSPLPPPPRPPPRPHPHPPPPRPHPPPPPPPSPRPPVPDVSDEELLRLAGATQSQLAPVPQSGTWDSISAALSAPTPAPGPSSATASSGGSSNLAAIIGGVVGGVVGGLLTAFLLFFWMRRHSRAQRRAGAGPMLAHNQAYTGGVGVDAKVSIVPGVDKPFIDLTEVVEATGSPHSARRRARTAFNGSDSPVRRSRSPQKKGGAQH